MNSNIRYRTRRGVRASVRGAALVVASCAAFACGGSASTAPREPDETTEVWTSGDDEAIGAGQDTEGEGAAPADGDATPKRSLCR